ncbi:hypothetical protein PISMIDRAFT_674200 [Pisolithus microcarpus 441]|uniref:Uncharacterized protein n=1 Tax=Pisolithus microcarpus 441 TaxID=765257 RepID=A0A0D0A0B6_9AGAM|nr:hypothetical protein PISMIDRAFT_674200 [Pisolithus microcarpus 441]
MASFRLVRGENIQGNSPSWLARRRASDCNEYERRVTDYGRESLMSWTVRTRAGYQCSRATCASQ